MIEFFKEGGFGMWPILFMSLALLAAAGWYAYRSEARHLGFIGALSAALLFASVGSTILDMATVCNAVATDARFSNQRPTIFLIGMKESTRPIVFGTTVLSIAALLVGVGMSRRKRGEEAATVR